jgi:ubiquinone/menaquinone biosynthesis C-methylase UbiE
LAEGYPTPIADETADVIYALDMFHMVEQPTAFLAELSRLLKPGGTIMIEDGHQPRSETVQKIAEAGMLRVIQENAFHVKCKKITTDNVKN